MERIRQAEDERFSNESTQKTSLQQVEHLFWQGKYQEALELLKQLKIHENVSEIERLKGQLLQCRILAYLDVKKAQDLATQVTKTSQALDQPLIGVDAQLVLAEAWLELGMLDASKTFLEQGKAQLASISIITSTDRIKREAMVLALESGLNFFKGEWDRAIECAQQSLMLCEQQNDPQAIAHSLGFLGMVYMIDFDRAVKYFQQSLMLREQLRHPPEIARSLFDLGRVYYLKGEYDQALEHFQKSRAIYEDLGIRHELAYTLAWIAPIYVAKGEFDRAMDILQNSLAICEQLGISGTFAEARGFRWLGQIYQEKGELQHALGFYQKSLALQEARGFKIYVGWCLRGMGEIYQAQGQLDMAIKYLLKALKTQEEVGAAYIIAAVLISLSEICLERGDLDSAHRYAHRLETLQEEMPSSNLDQYIMLIRALLLKASPRIRDKMHAQVLLRQITEDTVIWMDRVTVPASFHLCEVLFLEFKLSEDPAILHEIRTVTNWLLDLATAQPSYSVLTQTYFLQAKLALIEMDIPQARYLFTQAQTIADEKGLERLARSISHEHDTLLRQLPQWEALRAQKTSPTKASEFAGIEEQLTRIVRHRAVEPPALEPEDPILLLILTEGGLSVWTKQFALGEQLDAQLIGGLLTAINNFGKDAFVGSEGIDRIIYHGYTVAVKPLDVLLVCYVFQGESYLALQKLEQFIVRVQEFPNIREMLRVATKKDTMPRAIGDSEGRGEVRLHQLITDIFQPGSPSH